MPDSGPEIRDVYDQSLQEIGSVFRSLDASPEQVEEAKKKLRDLTSLMLVHTLDTIQGRTALLAGLIVELTDFTSKIQIEPKFLRSVEMLTNLADKAKTLLESEKKNLV